MPEGWVAKAEWLHVDLGSPQVCSPATCGGNANVNFRAEVFRVGINIPLTALMPRCAEGGARPVLVAETIGVSYE